MSGRTGVAKAKSATVPRLALPQTGRSQNDRNAESSGASDIPTTAMMNVGTEKTAAMTIRPVNLRFSRARDRSARSSSESDGAGTRSKPRSRMKPRMSRRLTLDDGV